MNYPEYSYSKRAYLLSPDNVDILITKPINDKVSP
nr:hypothetical protein CQNTEFLM_CQNTEFLM_CDS_0010 [uncultured phage]